VTHLFFFPSCLKVTFLSFLAARLRSQRRSRTGFLINPPPAAAAAHPPAARLAADDALDHAVGDSMTEVSRDGYGLHF